MGYFEIIRRNGDKVPLMQRQPFVALQSATQNVTLMGDDNVVLNIVSSQMLTFTKGDYLEVNGERYYVRTAPTRTIEGEDYYTMELTLYGVMYDLMKTLYRNTDANGKSSASTFDLTYTLKEFAKVIINNLNRDYPGIWRLDEANCPDTEPMTLSFSKSNCLAALQTLCGEDAFDTDFWIEQQNVIRIIHIGKFGSVVTPPGDLEAFEWGKGKGLYQLSEKKVDDKAVITRLWVEGGQNNLRPEYRDYSDRLQLPCPQVKNKKAHTLDDGTVIEADSETIGISDDSKRYMEGTSLSAALGVDEDVEQYDDIYPKRTGSVTSVVSGDPYSFVDSTMDFDLNEKDDDGNTKWLVADNSAKITFMTGKLAGQQFEVSKYDHSTKTFSLVPFTDSRGLVTPTEADGAYPIEAGAQYKITDIYLPDSYIEDAEEDLWYAGLNDFLQRKQPRASYELTFDRKFFLDNMPSDSETCLFHVGDYCPVKDERFGIDKNIRIQKVTRNLLVDHDYALTLSDTNTIGVVLQTIIETQKHSDIISKSGIADPIAARRGWRTTEDLKSMVFDTDGYFDMDNIRPNSIETNMLTVGAKSQQYLLEGALLQCNFNGNPDSFSASAATLYHLTIDDNGIRTWRIAANVVALTNANGYYVYARCSRTSDAASWFVTQQQIKFDSNASFYFFQVGIISVHYADDDWREFVSTYGFTRINGNTITTGKVKSSTGAACLDLDRNSLVLGDVLSFNTAGDGKLYLKGSLVQSQSGDTSPLPCFRGEYDNDTTYFAGDTVIYDNGTATALYIAKVETTGNLPTDSDYWALYGGGGVSYNGTDEFYQWGNSGTTAPTGKWAKNTIPARPSDTSYRYLWNFERVWKSDGTYTDTAKHVVGSDGKEIKGFTEYYQVTDSITAPAIDDENWGDTIPTPTSANPYLWNKEVVNYTDNSSDSMVHLLAMRGSNGAPGAPGISPNTSFKSYVFTRSNTQPDTPTGGSYASPIPTSGNWSDGVPSGEEMVWCSTRIFSSDGKSPQQSAWTAPSQMTDTADFDVEFSSVENPDPPSGHPNTNTDWSNESDETTIWMATSRKSNGVWTDWQIAKIKGESGEDGTSIHTKGTALAHYDSVDDCEAALSTYTSDLDASGAMSLLALARLCANRIVLVDDDDATCVTKRASIAILRKSSTYITGGSSGGTDTDIYTFQWTYSECEENDAYSIDGHIWVAAPNQGWIDFGNLKGEKGEDGTNGKNAYIHIKYAKSLTKNDWTANNGETPGPYIGLYCDTQSADQLVWSLYTWSKFQGEDGFGYEYIFKLSATDSAPDTPTATSQDDDFVPTEDTVPEGETAWSDNPQDVSAAYPYEWVCYRKKTDGVWGSFIGNALDSTKAALWAKYGATGNYTEYRFKATGSASTAPSVIVNASTGNPTGWTTTKPTLTSSLQYLWMIFAVRNGETKALVQSWSEPVRITGEKGENGKSPAPVSRGTYDDSKTYYGNEIRVDVVKYGSAWYVTRIDAPNGSVGFSGQPPLVSGTSTLNSDYWNEFGGNFESIATGLLCAELANIAGFIFKDNCLISQKGTIDDEPSEDFENDDFVPNIVLDGINGIIRQGSDIVIDQSGITLNDNDGYAVAKVVNSTIGSEVDLSEQQATHTGDTATENTTMYSPTTSGVINTTLGAHYYDIGYLCKGSKITFTSMTFKCTLPEHSSHTDTNGVTYKYTNIKFVVTLAKNYSKVLEIGSSFRSTGSPGDTINFSCNTAKAITIDGDTYPEGYYRLLCQVTITIQAVGSAGTTKSYTNTFTAAYGFEKAGFKKTLIGSDGMFCCTGSKQYLFASNDGFKMRHGANLLSVDKNGVRKSTDGGTSYTAL